MWIGLFTCIYMQGLYWYIYTGTHQDCKFVIKNSVFLGEGKMVTLQPLLKICGLELIDSNYKLVSNLPFISKLVESAVMNQFNTHCDLKGTTPIHQSACK